MRILGLDALTRWFRGLGAGVDAATATAVLRAANTIQIYAKKERFRRIPGVAHPSPRRYPPVSGILTSREGPAGYAGRISIDVIRPGQVAINAAVPYAKRHEAARPVLTRAIKDKERQVVALIGQAVYDRIKIV